MSKDVYIKKSLFKDKVGYLLRSEDEAHYYDRQRSITALSEGAEMASGNASCRRQLDGT